MQISGVILSIPITGFPDSTIQALITKKLHLFMEIISLGMTLSY